MPTRFSNVIVVGVAVLFLWSLPVLIDARECTSIDIRNNLASMHRLDNCTVIRGHLLIVLLSRNISFSDYDNLTFPQLREITDYFILYDVKGLTSFKKLLPNLTVIRGRRLFLNYAMAVANMPDLATFEFKSLVAIQRGHVFVGSCPKLCFLEKVNWDRLTLAPGENQIIPMEEATCPTSDCIGCESEYCWSNMVCQKFENDNVVNLALGSLHCHSECLGGCYNTTNVGCVVCKGITNHGVCVTECPSDMYYSEHHQRCYTKAECRDVRGYVLGNECNRGCPSGYISSRKISECIKCASGCNRVCIPPDGYTAFLIFSLSEAESLRSCTTLNGSLYIEFQNKIDEKDLLTAFENIHEVQGYIKIVNSPYIKSLGFLRNLEKVHGQPSENKTFAFVLYNNDNLQELWSPTTEQNVQFNGGIYSYSNYKLCNRILEEFAQAIVHDKDKDLMELNDQEVLCDPAKLHVEVMHVTQNNATISWARNQTTEEVEVIYREAKYNKGEQSELDDHVCTRINWKRDLMLMRDIPHNSSHFVYEISGLKPNTLYEILVKTFNPTSAYSARSSIKFFTTTPDYPTAPKVVTLSKKSDSITLTWTLRSESKEIVTYYWLETFEQAIDLKTLDSMNFCERPIQVFGVSPLEDYEDCCQRREQERQDEKFKRAMEATFPCTVRSKENCKSSVENILHTNTSKIDAHLQTYTVNGLKPFTLYTFFLYACNDIGCGNYYMYSDETELNTLGDVVDIVDACRVPDTKEYHLTFSEPKNPNGAIVSYTIHFEEKQNTGSTSPYRGQLKCLTRRQHEMADFQYVAELNYTFERTAVRTTSLAGSDLSKWFEIAICKNYEPERGIGAMGVFLICFLLCGAATMTWMSIRKHWWRRINFKLWRRQIDRNSQAVRLEDRQGLVSAFETVSFQNTPDD